MKSDHPFYEFMLDYPKHLFEFLGLSDLYSEDYEFTSPTVKQTEFRADGYFRGKELPLPMVFIELNFYEPENIYLKTINEAWTIYVQTKDRPGSFYVFIIFDKKANDPGCNEFVQACMPSLYFQVIYLEEIVNFLPDNPYFTLIHLMASKLNYSADVEKIIKVYEHLPRTELKYLDLCLSLLSSKYPKLDHNHLYAMFPSFKDELKQSVAVQNIVNEEVAVVTQKVMSQRSIEIARNLIQQTDFTTEKIASLTGLSILEVEKLMKSKS